MPRLVKPIIVLGTGRCGSTIVHELLCAHPEVTWLSGFCNRYPARPAINRRLVTAMGNPLFRRLFGRKVHPDECYRFWDQHAYGFSEPCRDLTQADVTAMVKQQVRAVLEAMMTPQRHRLLFKITGWSRLGYLNEIFEDAKFVHLIRDGRAVASSLLHVGFWQGWRGPQGWRAGPLCPEDQATWEAHDRSFVALAALEWRIRMRATEEARRTIDPSRFIEVRYEDFCVSPVDTIRTILDFAELPRSQVLENGLAVRPIRNAPNRWRHRLTAAQQRILDDILGEELERYGYGAAQGAHA